MNAMNDGGPAFPRPSTGPSTPPQEGMSIRDWFAGQALAGLCATEGWRNNMPEAVSRMSVAIADAMLKAREGGAKW